MEAYLAELVTRISEFLKREGFSLSIAESCTGGLVSHIFTNIPVASNLLNLSIICYSKDSKIKVLGINESLLDKKGMISEETAIAMANAVRRLGNSDIGLSITGNAGPDVIEGKNAGLVYIAVDIASKGRVLSTGEKFDGDMENIKNEASFEALQFLCRALRICT
ncbi:MAG: CinA family protein [Nitrospirota bacterium]|nr:CinA family protein [Nitrospirota bacterium]